MIPTPRDAAGLPRLRHALLLALGVPAAACAPDATEQKDPDITDVTGSGGTTGTTDTGTASSVCPGAESLTTEAGDPTGYVRCFDGAINRTDAVSWASPSACTTDADCGDGSVCISSALAEYGGGDETVCIQAACTTGDDCDSGECGLSTYDDGCGPIARLVCRTEDDACRSDDDCPDGANQCVLPYWSDAAWDCAGFDCAIGRPLLQSGRAVVSDIQLHDTEPFTTAGPLPDADTRGLLAAWWAHVAQAEHASVASFARVTLELMSLSAPPQILAGVQAAAADEIDHAQRVFSLASRFAGVALVPAPLPTEGVCPRQGREAVLRALIEEACVGETVGVAEARLALAGCRDAETCAVLRRIVDDETRHSALAWQTLRWLLDAHPELHDVATTAFTDAVHRLLESPTPPLPHLPEWGVLGENERRVIREDAVVEVVLPCAQAALGRELSPLSA